MYVKIATTIRIKGKSNFKVLNSTLVKSNIAKIPLKINVATKILTASSLLFLNKRKKINKLTIEIKIIKKMFNVTKNSSAESNNETEPLDRT